VDITNYVMLELGHPMHAFDLAKLASPTIRIRRAHKGETIRTLDGVERHLQPEMLAIADKERACAVAGVMGGADSEVTETTQAVVLEAAYFHPISIRRTSKILALATDASYRFERGADIGAPTAAMTRALQLLEDFEVGQLQGTIVDHFPEPPIPNIVQLRHARIEHLLGQQVDKDFVAPTLKRLGFSAQLKPPLNKPTWRVQVPTFRVDVKREEDLIEEIARHHGYDRLPTTFPMVKQPSPPPGPWRTRDDLIRRLLTGCGFSEAITYAFIEQTAAQAIHPDHEDIVKLSNPLSEKASVLRPSLLPGLVDSLIHNRRRQRQDVRLFEIGSRFRQSEGESPALGMVMTGSNNPKHWSSPDRTSDLFDMIGVVMRLCSGFRKQIQVEQTRLGHMVPGRTARINLVLTDKKTQLGEVGQLKPEFAVARGLTGTDAVYVAEFDLRSLDTETLDNLRAAPVPRHPSVSRDLSIEIDNTLPAAEVRGTILTAAGPTLVGVTEIDRYTGKEISSGAVSLSYRLTFRAADRTLTDEEVQLSIDAVLGSLIETYRAKQR
jgi:phenylalanyl-tRNA synthetase beta chain